MDVKEAERVVVAKPVASRPTCSTFGSFSELLAGAIDASPSPVSAIRPKTVRFKAGFVSSQAISGPALTNSSHHIPKPDSKPSLVYKPMAKLVSKATVSLLANMGNCSTSHQHPQLENFRTSLSSNIHQSNTPRTETNKITEPCKVVVSQAQNLEEDQKTLPSPSYGDRPSYDGYNWRKYGQKHVKGSEYPRSYYKCTHPNCPVKKKVERSFDGQIAEIVYKDEHSHSRPQPLKRNSAGTQGSGICQNSNNNSWSNQHGERNEGRIENQNDKGLQLNDSGVRGSPENSCGQSGECEEGSKGFDAEEDEPRSKRRKKNQSNEAAVPEESVEPRVVVPSSADSEIPEDGFRWRKYGQKAVKGNPYPRSYYRCTYIKCKVRKHVERAIDDPRTFITTYEGKHNHEMLLRIT